MSLDGLFLYCSRLAASESDELDKLVGVYPGGSPADARCQVQGFVEAMHQFAGEFGAPAPRLAIDGQRRRFASIRCELDFHLVIVTGDPVAWSAGRLFAVLDHCYATFKVV